MKGMFCIGRGSLKLENYFSTQHVKKYSRNSSSLTNKNISSNPISKMSFHSNSNTIHANNNNNYHNNNNNNKSLLLEEIKKNELNSNQNTFYIGKREYATSFFRRREKKFEEEKKLQEEAAKDAFVNPNDSKTLEQLFEEIPKDEKGFLNACKSFESSLLIQSYIKKAKNHREHIQFLKEKLEGKIPELSKHERATFVIQRILSSFDRYDKEWIAEEILDDKVFMDLCTHSKGAFVVLKMGMTGGFLLREALRRNLFEKLDQLKEDKYGKTLVNCFVIIASRDPTRKNRLRQQSEAARLSEEKTRSLNPQ